MPWIRPGGVLDKVRRKILGPPDKIPQRILTIGIGLLIALALAGAWLATWTEVNPGASSLPILRPILNVATSVWTYVIVLGWILRRLLIHRDKRYARQAADVTGYETRSVRRLAYEAKSADGSTRVIATDKDEPEAIESRILEALRAEKEDETLSLNPDAFEDLEEDDGGVDEGLLERRDEIQDQIAQLEQEADALQVDLDKGLSEVLDADLDPAKILESEDDVVAPADLLPGEEQDRLADLDDKESRLEDILDEIKTKLEELEELEEEIQEQRREARESSPDKADLSEGDVTAPTSRRGRLVELVTRAASGLKTALLVLGPALLAGALWHVLVRPPDLLPPGTLSIPMPILEELRAPTAYLGVMLLAGAAAFKRLRADPADGTAGGSAGDAADDIRWLEQYKLFRLDLAATLSFDEILWHLVIPAGAAIAAALLALQIWLPLWLYPPIFAGGLLVGTLNYVRIRHKRSRRLDSVRADRETINFAELAILVKEVEIPETRIQYAWFGDDEPRRYAHDDRKEFAAAVAQRAYESVNGVPISPSIMEKQADQLERFYPDLHGYRDQERKEIMSWLVEAIDDSSHGLVPLAKLIEDCIEHDLVDRHLGSGTKGQGHDPDLVREAYRELVPAALVEQEIELDHSDGETETITAVRKRDDPLPPRYGSIRAQFSSQFGNYARWDPLYELPDVEGLSLIHI